MKFTWDQIVFVLWFVTCCTSSPGQEKAKPPIFDNNLSSLDGFQSWEDWLAKRGLEGRHWDIGELPRGSFQNWQEMSNKRGIGYPTGLDNFGVFDNSKFQEWKDWVSKRDSRSGAPFAGFTDFDNSQFQQWNDWVSKRHFDFGVDGFGHGPSSSAGMQNWADFVKRQSFVYPSTGLGISNNAHFQDWQDWMKRQGSYNPSAPKAFGLGNKDRFIKRQLGFGPDRYSSFSRYFKDGLQDWRSAFRSVKRNKGTGDKPLSQQ